MRRKRSIEQGKRSRDSMSARGVDWTWRLLSDKPLIGSVGEKELRVSLLLLSPRLQRDRQKTMSSSPSSRSWSLWRRARWLLTGWRVMAGESVFRLWLARELEVADFGALTLREVRDGAQRDLDLDRVTVDVYLVRACSSGGEFKSDGVIVTFR